MPADSQPAPAKKSERFETLVTVLIALVSTVIALVASQAAVASGDAAEAQHNGVLAKINRERVDGGSLAQVARNRRAFDTYRFNRRLSDLAFEYIGRAEAQGASAHGTRMRLEAAGYLEDSSLAANYLDLYYYKYDDELGEYTAFDEDIFMNEERQVAATFQDTEYEDDFAAAEKLRSESLLLNSTLLVWFLALMFLTWSQITKSLLRWFWLAAGAFVGLGITLIYLGMRLFNVIGS